MSESQSSQERPGCRSILVRLVFRSGKERLPRSWLATGRPLRLLVTFTRTKKIYQKTYEQESSDS